MNTKGFPGYLRLISTTARFVRRRLERAWKTPSGYRDLGRALLDRAKGIFRRQ